MTRPLRIEFPGALYHVTSRGNDRRDIFIAEEDKGKFLAVFSDVVSRFNWRCHAYCLMSNHYHLLIETADGNLSKGMRQLNGVYTQYVNFVHQRVGHLFQGRFKGILVERESYLLELARYIVLNPVRAGLAAEAGDWPWSSFRATAGLATCPPFLTTDWLLSQFGERPEQAAMKFARFVEEGNSRASPWVGLKGQIFLGSERFMEEMQGRIAEDQPLRDIPLQQRRPPPKDLAEYASRHPDRNQAMAEAYNCGGYSLQAIGDFFGVSRMTVSRAVKKSLAEFTGDSGSESDM